MCQRDTWYCPWCVFENYKILNKTVQCIKELLLVRYVEPMDSVFSKLGWASFSWKLHLDEGFSKYPEQSVLNCNFLSPHEYEEINVSRYRAEYQSTDALRRKNRLRKERQATDFLSGWMTCLRMNRWFLLLLLLMKVRSEAPQMRLDIFICLRLWRVGISTLMRRRCVTVPCTW